MTLYPKISTNYGSHTKQQTSFRRPAVNIIIIMQQFWPITQTHGQTTEVPHGNTGLHIDKTTSHTTSLERGTLRTSRLEYNPYN